MVIRLDAAPVESRFHRVAVIASLIFAGEAIFGLPFHVSRFFRPTVLRVLSLSNTELGMVMSTYGVMAMLAYFPGGAIADRFSARKLLTSSMLLTALGGLYLQTMPEPGGLKLLFGFWGVTTILLFWAALIRATREWGRATEQGRAFGLLDGGRGLLAAGLASIATLMFGWFFPEDPQAVSAAERAAALRNVIHVYTATTFAGGLLTYWLVPEAPVSPPGDAPKSAAPRVTLATARRVLRVRAVWLQAVVVVCAYCAYKGADDYALFAVESYGLNEVEAARLTALTAWTRPVAAVLAGVLADRITASRVCLGCFALLAAGYASLATLPAGGVWLLGLHLVVISSAVFALRGVYFALLEESVIPRAVTGTAVGLISVIGYTPDVFASPLMGWLLDRSPGPTGHQHFFVFLLSMSALGLLATLLLRGSTKRPA